MSFESTNRSHPQNVSNRVQGRLDFLPVRAPGYIILIIVFTGLLFIIATLSGCEAIPQTPDATQIYPATNTPTPVKEITPTPASAQTLIIWVPPQFDPANGTIAGDLFQKRLDAFEAENPDIHIQVRVKSAVGPSNLIESLTNTSTAAPKALPSLIALSRSDLETAALKGLIIPLDNLTSSIDDPDWYIYARQMALIQGSLFGLPFAGDALLLCYRPEKVSDLPATWVTILKRTMPVTFPAADPQSLFALTLYQSLGGKVEDDQHRPLLQPEILKEVLDLFSKGANQGIFPQSLTTYQTDGQSWQAYQDQQYNWVITWASKFLADAPPDTAAQPLPVLGKTDYTISSGWVWAVADPSPAGQALSVKLANYLVDGNFLADWTSSAGFLPTRSTALAAWKNQSLQATMSQVILSAQNRPTNDLLAGLGPVLADAVVQVIKNEADPAQAAQKAAEQIIAPETK